MKILMEVIAEVRKASLSLRPMFGHRVSVKLHPDEWAMLIKWIDHEQSANRDLILTNAGLRETCKELQEEVGVLRVKSDSDRKISHSALLEADAARATANKLAEDILDQRALAARVCERLAEHPTNKGKNVTQAQLRRAAAAIRTHRTTFEQDQEKAA